MASGTVDKWRGDSRWEVIRVVVLYGRRLISPWCRGLRRRGLLGSKSSGMMVVGTCRSGIRILEEMVVQRIW